VELFEFEGNCISFEVITALIVELVEVLKESAFIFTLTLWS
jgi:hypothetical protein